MSADLFAEFSSVPSDTNNQHAPPTQSTAQPATTFSFLDNLSGTTPTSSATQPALAPNYSSFNTPPAQAPADDENDDWGDFESGFTTTEYNVPARDPFAFTATQPVQAPGNSPAPASGPFDFSSGLSQPQQYKEPQPRESWQRAPIIKAKKSTDSRVLFDVEDEFDDDEFGDFEGTGSEAFTPAAARTPAPPGGSSALVDLLGDLSVSQPTPPAPSSKEIKTSNAARKSASTSRKSPIGGFGTTQKAKQPPATSKAAEGADDGWDTFEDWEATIPTKAPTKTNKKPTLTQAPAPTSSTPAPILSPLPNDPQPGELPPTNVPPPGQLMSLFPTLFGEAQEKLFKPMAAQPLAMRNRILAEPATVTFLQGYLMLVNVAAHIIAGRKLRWKRDQHLSQGMRIGPASSRATSGMKLTGIDKGENLKEEREVADVVRVWKDQVGRLRHVVSGTNQIKAGTLGAVPELAETLAVKTLKQSEGGVPARQPCMLCGLKRDERVTAADMTAQDSFGEWWVDQVNMHRGCRNFWSQHKDRLRHG